MRARIAYFKGMKLVCVHGSKNLSEGGGGEVVMETYSLMTRLPNHFTSLCVHRLNRLHPRRKINLCHRNLYRMPTRSNRLSSQTTKSPRLGTPTYRGNRFKQVDKDIRVRIFHANIMSIRKKL